MVETVDAARPRALVCPDKFRGSLSAAEAADHMAAGCAAAGVTEVVLLPLADGGEGTLDALCGAANGRRARVETVDAVGRPTTSAWCLMPDGSAVVEASTSIGLAMLGDDRAPMTSTSAGVGRVIAQVLAEHPRRLVVTVGGVATTDGGLGCLEELGWSLRGVETVVLCDVSTRFVDAARVYGPQKGADPVQVRLLGVRLEDLAVRYRREARDVSQLSGGGAAGGLAGGLAAIGATLESGFGQVAQMVDLDEHIRGADLVLTGEGRLDPSSLQGKVVDGVTAAAARLGVPVAVLAGATVPETAELLRAHGVVVGTVRERAHDEIDSFARAGRLLEHATAEAVRELGAGRQGARPARRAARYGPDVSPDTEGTRTWTSPS